MKKLLLIATSVFCCTQVWARTLYVSAIEYSSIQSAINDANEGDTVVVSEGTYQENIDFLGKAITVQSVNPNDPNVVAATIIDGSNPPDPNIGSVVTFGNGENVKSVLSGFTITGGTGSWLLVSWEFKGLRWNRCGGGVVCFNMSAPTICKNAFKDNIAGQGGGIYIYGDPVNPEDPSDPVFHIRPVITGNSFINNYGIVEHGFGPPDNNYPNNDHGDGGAVVGFQGCDATITGNLIENNHADFYGGGIHLRQWSNGLIEDNQITGNDSALGAGLHITYTSSPVIRYNLIESNTGDLFGGGGIYVYYLSNPLVCNNVIKDNVSGNGAGFSINYTSAPTIMNNLIINNRGLSFGGGIKCTGSNPIIKFNTIAGNSATSKGAGISCLYGSSPTIEHNLVVNCKNEAGIYVMDTPQYPASPIIRYNNVYNNQEGNYSGDISDQTNTNGNISVPPEFIDADNYNYRLNYTSECINAGDPNFDGEGQTNYEGNARKMGQFVDIGAYETRPVWNVSSDENYIAVQDAIDNASNGDTIIVTPGRYYERISFGKKNLVLRSADPNNRSVVQKTIIDANQTGTVVVISQGQDSNSAFAGFTVTGGEATNGHGGGIYCYASPRIEHNIIRDNHASFKGGGVYFWSSDAQPLLNNNIIINNTANSGAGVFADTSSKPAISRNTISHNHAEKNGGGISCSKNRAKFTIGYNQIIGNTAKYGGGIFCQQSPPLIVNNLVCGNAATEHGGAMEINYSSPDIINNSIVDSRAPIGAGIYCTINADPNVANNIVAFSPQGEGICCLAHPDWPSEPNLVCNDVYDNNNGNYGGSLADQTGLNGNISVDPNFVSLGFWDDANTPDDANDDFFVWGNYHILPNSPCIDAGDNNSIPVSLDVDIDGEERIFGDTVDIGADELVTNPADFNTDGIVDFLDISTLVDEWFTGGSQFESDLYDDDFIDFADYAELAQQWYWTGGWHE